jgi:hypothetical protein
MGAPSEPYVDIVTGRTYGTFDSPGSFYWYNSKAAGGSNCTVSASGNWSDKSSYPDIAPQSSASASIVGDLASGNYPWSCPCCQLGSPRVPIVGGHPKPPHKSK